MDTSPFVFDTFVSMERFLDVAVGTEADVNAVRKILSSCSLAQLLEIVNYQDDDAMGSYINACTAEVVELFLEYGVNLDPLGTGLFDILPHFGEDTTKLSMLLDHGVNVNTHLDNGRNWLHIAASRTRPQLPAVQLLLAHGVDIDARDTRKWSPMRLAVMCHVVESLDSLLLRYANPNLTCDRSLHTILHVAVSTPDYKATERLLAYGADCHARTETRDTALHLVAKWSRHPNAIKIAQLLLHYGASKTAQNYKGETPRDKAYAAIKPGQPLQDLELQMIDLLSPDY